MVSGNSNDSTVVKCLKLGANDYIKKPVHFEVAVMRILNQLKLTDSIQVKMHLHELAAINAMITTYHHEINNPLTIAKMKLMKLKKVFPNEVAIDDLSTELERIVAVVQKIQEIRQHKSVLFEPYSGDAKMVKVK
jgi:DNA-binding response OmpR family regulator